MSYAKSFLELQTVRKEYAGRPAVSGFDLTVRKGEFVSFLGPSGCGKTTTVRMIAGYIQPTSGRIVLDGQDVTEMPPQRRNMGMVFQDYALFPHLTVQKNVEFGLRVRKMTSAKRAAIAKEMLALVGLADAADLQTSQLSGGMQQRVAIARALAIDPELLLLDEPFSALDAKTRESLRQEVLRIHSETGITTILVTHDQSEAFELSDRVVLMNSGEIEQVATPRELYRSPATQFASDFIGRSVKLPAMKVEQADAGGIAAFMTKSGSKVWATEHTPSEGTDVVLAIRPETLEIVDANDAESSSATRTMTNTWAGVIRDRLFFGPSEEVNVYVEDLGVELPVSKETRAGTGDWSKGQAVRVLLNAHDVLVIPAHADSALSRAER